MDLHYKAYQKIKIYLDKIRCSQENLQAILTIAPFPISKGPITARIKELELMKAHLAGFCLNLKSALPYVPPSRCKAFTAWYGAKTLFAPNSPSKFRENLMEADNEVLLDASYAILSDTIPTALRNIFVKHADRYGKIRKSLKIVQEDLSVPE